MSDLSAFIALWDKEFGAKIVNFYPKSSQLQFDLEFITSKIFFAFQNLNFNGISVEMSVFLEILLKLLSHLI